MNEDSQIVVPDAFVALFQPPADHPPRRGTRPTAPRALIAERHELCEDLAQMLTETARQTLFELGVAESDVLDRIRQGLQAEGGPLSPAEAGWVTGRLAELLEWPLPEDLLSPRPPLALRGATPGQPPTPVGDG